MRPSWNSVSGLAFAEPDGDPPELGRGPVATTTPRPVPSCTTVPMNRHEDSSARAVPAGRPAAGGLRRRHRLAGEDRLVAFQVARRQEPDVGRDDRSRRCSCTTSPGTSVRRPRPPPAGRRGTTVTMWRISECIASARPLGAVLVGEPEPDRRGDDHADDHAHRGPRRRSTDTAAAASSSHSSGLRSCRASTPKARALWSRTAFGPTLASRAAACGAVSPAALPSSRSSTSAAGSTDEVTRSRSVPRGDSVVAGRAIRLADDL